MGYFTQRISLDSPPIDFKPNFIFKSKDIYSGELIKEKDIILKYLTMFKPNFSSSGKIYDYILKREIEHTANFAYYDGVYLWDEADIYNIKNYNMPLKQEFIEYVVKKMK